MYKFNLAPTDSICFYFLLGLRHWEMLMSVNADGIRISLSTLRRHLKSMGLFRRKAQFDLLEVTLFLHKCIQAGLVVTQRTVRHLLLKHCVPNCFSRETVTNLNKAIIVTITYILTVKCPYDVHYIKLITLQQQSRRRYAVQSKLV